jgi:retron-type reverse transcriptase
MLCVKLCGYYKEGYSHVVAIGIAKRFASISHDRFLDILRGHVTDKSLISPVGAFLKSGVLEGLTGQPD